MFLIFLLLFSRILQELNAPQNNLNLSEKLNKTDARFLKLIPDISIVYNIILECEKSMALYDCYDQFFEEIYPEDNKSRNLKPDKTGLKWKNIDPEFWGNAMKKKRKNLSDPSDPESSRETGNKIMRSSSSISSSSRSKLNGGNNLNKDQNDGTFTIDDTYPGVKCRFSAAIDILEKYGLIKISSNGTQIQRLVFAWDSIE